MSDIKLNDLEKGSNGSQYDEELYTGDSTKGYVDTGTNSTLRFINKVVKLLDAESHGIERIPENERNPNEGVLEAASMWFSANLVISALVLGFLGQTIGGLSFWESVLTIIFFNILGMIFVAYYTFWGSLFGLRQMILSRFLLGNIGVRIFTFLTAIACIGWGAVNSMSSAQLLNLVNRPHSLPPWAGLLIIVLLTIIVSMFGYRAVHLYEKYSWIPNLAVFFVLIARFKISGAFNAGEFSSGEATAAGVLTFGGAIFGFAAGWTTYAADYTVYIRNDYPKWKLFIGTAIGLFLPLVFCNVLGAAIITGINTNETYAYYYENYQSGGLLFAILAVDSVGGFGQFCAVILALSTVANNIPNMYTIAFCAQAFWSPLRKVPRIVWTVLGNCLTLAISIPAYYHFQDFISNFMNLISYYLAIYIALTLSEHFIWNRNDFSRYDPTRWDDKSYYPVGIAAAIGFCFGIAGCVLGMDQVWYLGKIGGLINPNSEYPGADIGFELSFGFAFIGYNIFRPLELKYIGR
ncbi:hypothetical protein WICMUC_000386 [Wickerhamomyces mucosus]|uniref:Purine-cytosine permease n=1 Tax=Wickerhamomyces mucosus TaxID=1378264 RepID=A0A9P8PZZ2_9ASCO|nr:hypothetical protein WICMUC_000386 [Wickerhamomyces mucosus]